MNRAYFLTSNLPCSFTSAQTCPLFLLHGKCYDHYFHDHSISLTIERFPFPPYYSYVPNKQYYLHYYLPLYYCSTTFRCSSQLLDMYHSVCFPLMYIYVLLAIYSLQACFRHFNIWGLAIAVNMGVTSAFSVDAMNLLITPSHGYLCKLQFHKFHVTIHWSSKRPGGFPFHYFSWTGASHTDHNG